MGEKSLRGKIGFRIKTRSLGVNPEKQTLYTVKRSENKCCMLRVSCMVQTPSFLVQLRYCSIKSTACALLSDRERVVG
jgi:hypothetical protein